MMMHLSKIILQLSRPLPTSSNSLPTDGSDRKQPLPRPKPRETSQATTFEQLKQQMKEAGGVLRSNNAPQPTKLSSNSNATNNHNPTIAHTPKPAEPKPIEPTPVTQTPPQKQNETVTTATTANNAPNNSALNTSATNNATNNATNTTPPATNVTTPVVETQAGRPPTIQTDNNSNVTKFNIDGRWIIKYEDLEIEDLVNEGSAGAVISKKILSQKKIRNSKK